MLYIFVIISYVKQKSICEKTVYC